MYESKKTKKIFLSSTRREPSFIVTGFTNWKEANKGFSNHESSACHLEVVDTLCLLPAQIVGHIDDMSDDCMQQKEINRKFS